MQHGQLYYYIIFERRGSMDVVKDEVIKELNYIDEKKYQQFKKKMGKKGDYFSFKELEILQKM